MRGFVRADPPAWWADHRQRWNDYCLKTPPEKRVDASKRLNGWKRNKRTLADHFHALVRPSVPKPVCAYCDGPLREQSPPTIDHFFPAADHPLLAFAWANLYPACYTCNSTNKGTRCNPNAARPDMDPVDVWFDLDAETGVVKPADELGAEDPARQKVLDAIDLFGLNTSSRPEARKRTIRQARNAVLKHNGQELEELRRDGIYVFVIDAVVRSLA